MPIVPEDPVALAAFALIFAGTGVVVLARNLPKAYALALLLLGVFFLQMARAAGPIPGLMFDLGLLTGPFLAGATWWTPFTYMYLHGSLRHLVGNLIILVTAGPALEDRVGPKWFFVVYFLAGFAAAAAHIVLTWYGVLPDRVAVGASGAIFGILTAFAVRYPRELLPIPLILIIRLPAFVVLLIYLGLNLAYMLVDTNIAWYGHFAGFLVGLPAAILLERRKVDATAVGRRDFPDVEKLRPLAESRVMHETLDKAARFTGEHKDDAEFANAWVDRFLTRARCPHDGTPLERDGFEARCPRGDYAVEFKGERR